MNNPVLAIVVTHNCDKGFRDNMIALEEAGADILLVDNGSGIDGIRIIKNYLATQKVFVVWNSANTGIAHALNQGADYAREIGYHWILTLDQDSLVTPGMIQTMLNVYESLGDAEKEITAGLFALPIEKSQAQQSDFVSQMANRKYRKVKVGITSGNMLRTEIFEKVGFFDEKLFIDYVDHDFYLRLASAGYQLLECEGAKLIHQRGNYIQKRIIGRTLETSNHSALRKYYITRNRMYMWKTYGQSHPDFVWHDKKTFCIQLLKLLLVEDDRWEKFIMVVKGAMDCRRARFGKLNVKTSLNTVIENSLTR